MRPCDSVSGTRCTRCPPPSKRRCRYAPRPRMLTITSLNPPRSDGEKSETSNRQRFDSQYLRYISYRSPAKMAASSPPVPARISTKKLSTALSSAARNSSFNSSSNAVARDSASGNSAAARSDISLSAPLLSSRNSLVESAALRYSRYLRTTGSIWPASLLTATSRAEFVSTAESFICACSSSNRRAVSSSLRMSAALVSVVCVIAQLHRSHLNTCTRVADKQNVSAPIEPLRHSDRIDIRMWLLLCLCVISAILGRMCYLIRPFDSDGSMFIYMGRLISEGGRFCHDLVDNKFTSVGLITSVPWRLFGANWSSYVWLGAAMSIVSCAMLTRTAIHHIGESARWPAMLFAIVYFNFNFAVFGGFQLETMQALFTIIAAGAALDWLRDQDWRDAFLLGLAAGVAAMCKPTGVAVIGACAITFIFTRRALSLQAMRHAAALAAGSFLPALVVLAHL